MSKHAKQPTIIDDVDGDLEAMESDPGYGTREVSGRDRVYVFPQMMAEQLDRYADRLKTLASLARLGTALSPSMLHVRDGGSNGGEHGATGRLLEIVESEVQKFAQELLYKVRATTTRDALLADM